MKRLAPLLTAGACALAASAHADEVPASISNQSPQQAAMSEAITQLLIGKLGEDALWTQINGRAKQYNQFMYVNVPEHAITLGRATFDNGVRFQVNKSIQWVENCNGTEPLPKTVSTTTDVVNSYYTTQARNSQSTLSHTVTLDAKVGTGLGSYVETSYSFNRTDNTSENSSTRTDHSDEKEVKETVIITAEPGQSVAYQVNQVVLAPATASTFTASASINTAAVLEFYVKTIGTLTPDVGMTGSYVSGFDNSPTPGQTHAAADLRVAGQVLRSVDGGFIFGVETGRGSSQRYGNWSVVDLNASQPAAPARLWSPLTTSACATALDFYITASGQLQLRCGSVVKWQSNTNVSTGNPCFYLTFAPEAPGELACYSFGPKANGGMGQLTFLSGAVATRTMGDEIRPGLRLVKKTLAQLLPNSGAKQDVIFTGSFDGSIGVLGPVHCLVSYVSRPDATGTICNLQGLTGTAPVTGGKSTTSRTPSGQITPVSYCGPTNAFLQPYLARNPMAVGGN